MSKKILIIDANPSKFGFTACLAEEYAINAEKSGFNVKTISLRNLKFDPILHYGYNRVQKLEPDLENAQELIKWCEHLVIFTPVWWYSSPALLKGFLDRVFLPGFAFEIEVTTKRKVNKMLSGKTASLFYTYGGPKKNVDKIKKDLFELQIKDGILCFCGFEKIKTYTLYETVGFRNIKRRQKFIDKVTKAGKEGK